MTVLDFALIVYGKRCKNLKLVRINGREKDINTLLKNGDVIAVKFGKKNVFKPNWKKIIHHKKSQQIIEQMCNQKSA